MAGMNVPVGQLGKAWKTLRLQWEDARTLWNDPVRWDFEKEYWALLDVQVPDTLGAMEHLQQVIAQARQRVK